MNENISSAEDDMRALECFNQGEVLMASFNLTGDLGTINRAIEYETKSISLTPDWHTDMPMRLEGLGIAYARRFQRLGNLEDIHKSIENVELAQLLTEEDDPAKPQRLHILSGAYFVRFNRLEDRKDLDQAIEYEMQARLLTPKDHPHFPARLSNLGMLYYARFNLSGNLDDLNNAIDLEEQAYYLCDKEDPDMARSTSNLKARSRIPKGHFSLPALLDQLGNSYSQRFDRLDDLAALDKAIQFKQEVLSLTPEGHPSLPLRVSSLGDSYLQRLICRGDLSDLDEATTCGIQTLTLIPEGSPSLPACLINLSAVYYQRFKRLDDLAALDSAIEYQLQSRSLIPDKSSAQPKQSTALGELYYHRHSRLGSLDDLAQSIECLLQACSLTTDGDPELPTRLNLLSVAYCQSFMRLGNVADLNNSIETSTKACYLTPMGHSTLAARLVTLSASYQKRFKRLGDLADLDKAIEQGLKAQNLTSEGEPELPDLLGHLGVSYHQRFMRLHDPADLDKAIELKHRACLLASADNSNFHTQLSNLGMSYRERFVSFGNPEDLSKAIEYGVQARATTPKGHPDLTSVLSQLGVSYNYQFKNLGNRSALDNAIACKLEAYSLTLAGDHLFPARLANLSMSYSERFALLGDPEDLKKTIEGLLKASSLYPGGHPDLPYLLKELGHSHRKKYEALGEPNHIEQALDYFRQAARCSIGNPKGRLDAALGWARTARKYKLSDDLHGYQAAIEILPEFIWLGATIDQRYDTLGQLSSVAIEAASAAISSGEFTLAIEWLEQGRSIVWNQIILLRSPLDELHIHHPSLASRLQSLGHELHNAGSRVSNPEAPATDSTNLEQEAQKHHQLAQEYTDLLSQVRQLPGFENFLRPKAANELVNAARSGPVVIINVHMTRSDALVILPGKSDIHHIELPKLTYKGASVARVEMELSLGRGGVTDRTERRPIQSKSDQQQGFRQTLEMLWEAVAKPVLDFLGYNDMVASSAELPHIIWCTTGPLSFLPLHAAGYYDRPGSKLVDFAVSSYTPTLGALLASQIPSSGVHSSILAIGQEATSGMSSLPGTAKELSHIQEHATGTIRYTRLTNQDATPAAVLDQMEQHDWVHLACHAHQSIADPRKSGFFLHGGTLDLSTITQRSFQNKGLAFLSACQTATGDQKLADEAVHLASGMLIAGYPSPADEGREDGLWGCGEGVALCSGRVAEGNRGR
ncbi:CHAT domain-containing protein [Rhizoctonia solani]|nr:CHAT domain-containing protein [Rhizoctonia solani]